MYCLMTIWSVDHMQSQSSLKPVRKNEDDCIDSLQNLCWEFRKGYYVMKNSSLNHIGKIGENDMA